jgi:O-methyltransferase
MTSRISPRRLLASVVYRRYSEFVDKLNRTPLFVSFIKQCESAPCFDTREEMYEEIAPTGPIDYLEFGVWEGESILYWARSNRHDESRFFGFDTFTGLPENWGHRPAGMFNVEGKLPQTNDSRVSFVSGLFQETVPKFLADFEAKNRLVIHCDADLYSSTLYVLARLHSIMRPGTILIFDEFGDVQHEFRAFNDYVGSHKRSFRVLAGSSRFFALAVEIRD